MDREDWIMLSLGRAVGDSKVVTDPDHCARYARDESEAEPVLPLAVVHATSADDIARTLRACTDLRLPVFPRGAGTGRTGGAVPTSRGIVLDTMGLANVKHIDRENLLCVVEPGVITGALHAQVEAEGLFYPPDPNSLEWCAIGGNVAENAGGPRAFKYGVTRDYVLGMDAVTMSGEVLRVGRKTVKGVTGYDVTGLLVGSEGTLAVFSEITLRLIPKPESVRTLLALFRAPSDAARAVAKIVAAGLVPRCLELLDRPCCDAVRTAGVKIAEDVGALLVIEADGDESTVERAMERLGDACDAAGAMDVLVARHEGERAKLWEARRVMSRALRASAGFKLSEDIVVPRSALGTMIERVEAIAHEHSLRLPAYGHAGDGNLHVNFLWDHPEQRPTVDRAIESVFRTTLELGGTLTGEHGIGVLKRDYLPWEQSEGLIELQRGIKRTFDPHGLLNPGKVLPEARGHRSC